MRLDQYLVQTTKLSRHQVQKMIEQGLVRVDNRVVCKPARKIQGKESVQYTLPKSHDAFDLTPQAIPLNILYEDAEIAVINKPADLVIHPAAGNPSGTLVNALLHRYGFLPPADDDETKPGIVHRLDKGTSGVMVVARTAEALKNLQSQFKNRQTEKVYLTLVVGKIEQEGTIDKPLGRHPVARQKISTRSKSARPALTEWKVLKYFGDAFSWLEVRIHTGRTHQIRVHLADAGHPVVGDPTYGRSARKYRTLIARPALHALRLGLTHPKTGEKMVFEAPLPEDIQHVLSYAGTLVRSS